MTTFSHVVVGTNDLEKSRPFYDAVLAPFGLRRLMDMEGRSIWGAGKPEFIVTKPINGEPAASANGGTIGFAAATQEVVDQFHAAGLAAGGTCDGKPGLRPMAPGLYAAYVRDPDGNKLRALHQPAAA